MMAKKSRNSGSYPQKTTNIELVNTLGENLDRQLSMCQMLENFADNLPEMADAAECLSLSGEMLDSLEQAHQFEELILFPVLQAHYYKDQQLPRTLERLRFEHFEDESFAQELKNCLKECADARQADDINLLSYMLRGFFEGVRRHIAFEREHILPMLEQSIH